MLLVGLSPKDSEDVAYRYAEKVLNLRLWDEIGVPVAPKGTEDGGAPTAPGKAPRRWHSNLVQNNYGLLVVSQFTLYAKMKGNKPDFHGAMEGDQAKILFDKFVDKLRTLYIADRVQTGAFGEYMNVHFVNDGPVTIVWDSDKDDSNEESGTKTDQVPTKADKPKKEFNKAPKQKAPKETVMSEKGQQEEPTETESTPNTETPAKESP